MLKKKGVVSLTTFSFIMIVLSIMLVFSYSFYSEYKLKAEISLREEALLNSMISFRSELLNDLVYNNSNFTYSNSMDSSNIQIAIINSTFVASEIYEGQLVSKNVSILGNYFCDNYIFYPYNANIFSYNGSCVSLVT